VDFQAPRYDLRIIARDLWSHLSQNPSGLLGCILRRPEVATAHTTLHNGEFSVHSSVGADHSRIQ